MKGHSEAVKALVELGAAVDARDVSVGKGRGRELRDRQGVLREGRRGMRGSRCGGWGRSDWESAIHVGCAGESGDRIESVEAGGRRVLSCV